MDRQGSSHPFSLLLLNASPAAQLSVQGGTTNGVTCVGSMLLHIVLYGYLVQVLRRAQ